MTDSSLQILKYSIHTRLRQFHLEKIFPKIGKGNFLDVGCGVGYLSHILGSGWNKFGLDTDLNALKMIYKRGQKKILLSNAIKIPFKDQSMDVILCSEVLEHLPKGNDQEALSEMTRILKPGGRLLITVPSLEGLRANSYLRNLGHDDPEGGEYHYRVGYAWENIKKMIDNIPSLKVVNRKYAMFLFSELFMDLLKWVYHKKRPIKEQSDLAQMDDSRMFRVYRVFFPILHFLFLCEDFFLASFFKGHILIVALEKS